MSEKKAKEQRKQEKQKELPKSECCQYWFKQVLNKPEKLSLNARVAVECKFCPECGRVLDSPGKVQPIFSTIIDVYPPNGQIELRGFPEDFNYMMMVLGAAIQRLAQHFKGKELEKSRIIKPGLNVVDLINKGKLGPN